MSIESKYGALLSAASHEDVSVMFVEWAQERYWRTAKRVGGMWYEIGTNKAAISTRDMYKKFLIELDEELSAIELSAYYSQLEKESRNFGGL